MVRDLPIGAGGVLSYFTRHKTAANLLLVLLVVSGLLTLPNMRAQFFPDVVVDDISIGVRWNGAGAEDVDAAIVQLLEPVLLGVEGVTDAASLSREGSAKIKLEFEPGWDMARAEADVEAAIDQVSALPSDSDDPTIIRGNWRDRVANVVITGPIAVEQLGLFADELTSRLFDEGVTKTTIQGSIAPEVLVEVPSSNLIFYNTSMREIALAISQEVDTNPAGDVTGANARVRTGVEKRNATEIGNIVLRLNSDGSTLLLSDVAEVKMSGIDRERSYFVGTNPAIGIRIDRSQQGDAIDIQHSVETVSDKFQETLPLGTTVDLVRTRADYITGRLKMLLENGLTGLGLVVLLLFLFLNARTAFWVAAGIPTAMLAAITVMYFAGITINMISLFALIITLGIVVDDAIVVGEHADHRARMGLEPYEAAESAAKRMALPVFAATLTTIIAFFGLVVIGGRFGDLIADIPFTVVAVLAASLVECFLILPNHMAHSLKHVGNSYWYDWPSRVVNYGFAWFREKIFGPFTLLVISSRYVVLAGAIAILASQVTMVISGKVNWRFFNAPEQSSVTGNFAMVDTATRADTLAMMKTLQNTVEELGKEYEEKHGKNPVKYLLAEVGGNSGRGLSGTENKSNDLLGGIGIELIDADLRPYSSFAFVGELRERVPRTALLEQISFRGWRAGPGGDALDIQLFGSSSKVLKEASEELKDKLGSYSIVSALEDNLAYDKDDLILQLTPQGQAIGFTIDGLGAILRNRLNGIEAATFPIGPRSASISVKLPEGELTSDFLDRMLLKAPDGSYVPLADLVSVDRQAGFSTVRRENGIRLVSVTGDISEDDPKAAQQVIDTLKLEILPNLASKHQVEWQLAGLSEQEDRFLNEARIGFITCLIGIYLVLTWVFASWTRPIVVMAVIPFGLVGAIWGHYIWEVPLSMFSVVGFLGMTGIIINDSIVLITSIDEYARDRGIVPSIVDAVKDRLRPVILTTLTTVLGLTPLLYENSSQAQFLRPTVITLVYGLGFGMLLVLLVVPSLIAMQGDMKRFSTALHRGLKFRNFRIRVGFYIAAFFIVAWLSMTVVSQILIGKSLVSFPLLGFSILNGINMSSAFLLYLIGVLVILLIFYAVTAVNLMRSPRQRL